MGWGAVSEAEESVLEAWASLRRERGGDEGAVSEAEERGEAGGAGKGGGHEGRRRADEGEVDCIIYILSGCALLTLLVKGALGSACFSMSCNVFASTNFTSAR